MVLLVFQGSRGSHSKILIHQYVVLVMDKVIILNPIAKNPRCVSIFVMNLLSVQSVILIGVH